MTDFDNSPVNDKFHDLQKVLQSNMITENTKFSEFILMEKILNLLGYKDFTDYDTMVSLKDIKKSNKDGNLLISINKLLTSNKIENIDTIDEIFTFIRNKLVDIMVPFTMVHKNNGNYLKLVKKNVSLDSYLISKQCGFDKQLFQKPIQKYKDYNEFIEKNNKIYRSINTDTNILYDMSLHSTFNRSSVGIIRKKTIKNIFDENIFIYESNNKCYVKYSLHGSCEIIRNISCKLIQNGIILDDLNHFITLDNKIIEGIHDLIMLSITPKYHINIEISFDIYSEIIKRDTKTILIEYDEIVLDTEYRTDLQFLENLTYGKNKHGFIYLNEIKYMPVDYILYGTRNTVGLGHGVYSDFKYVDHKNKIIDKQVKYKTIRQHINFHGDEDEDVKQVIENDDVVQVDRFQSIYVKLPNKYKLSFKSKILDENGLPPSDCAFIKADNPPIITKK
jgi:hypothetical protein